MGAFPLSVRAVALLSLAATAAAWSADGHMTVARIALDSGIMSSASIAAANKLVAYLADQYPETGPSFEEIACWADDIRSQEPNTAGWHYIDIPVCRLSDVSQCTQPPADDNSVWAIEQAEAAIDAGAVTLAKARQLRFIVHFVGDIHQPLHAADYFSSDYPEGDRGGNSWPIAGVPPATNLHSYWDSGLGQWTANLHRPLNDTGRAWLQAEADKVRSLYPVSSVQSLIKDRNVTAWAYESHSYAETFVYTAPQAPKFIPANYTDKGREIVLQQLAIAGYRLATALELLLSAPRDAYQKANCAT